MNQKQTNKKSNFRYFSCWLDVDWSFGRSFLQLFSSKIVDTVSQSGSSFNFSLLGIVVSLIIIKHDWLTFNIFFIFIYNLNQSKIFEFSAGHFSNIISISARTKVFKHFSPFKWKKTSKIHNLFKLYDFNWDCKHFFKTPRTEITQLDSSIFDQLWTKKWIVLTFFDQSVFQPVDFLTIYMHHRYIEIKLIIHKWDKAFLIPTIQYQSN